MSPFRAPAVAAADGLYRDPTPRRESVCGVCAPHPPHTFVEIETAMGTRSSTGKVCFGCPLCRPTIDDKAKVHAVMGREPIPSENVEP